MGLVAQVLNPAQLPDGTYDSRNWRAKLIIEVTWQSLPAFGDIVVDTWAGVDFSALLNIPSGLTAAYSLTGSVPAGVAIHSSTGVMSQTGATPVTFTGRVVATVSSRAFPSPQFTINFIAAPVEAGDTEAPSYSMGLSATTTEVAGVVKVDLTILRPNDTAADDETPGGLASFTVLRDGSPIATDVAIADPGASIRLAGEALGSGTSGSVVRDGSDYLVTARGGTPNFGVAGENGHQAHVLVNRDGLDFAVAITSLTGTVVAGSSAGLRIASGPEATAARILAYANASGARVRRAASAGAAANALIAPLDAVTIPCQFRARYIGSDQWELLYAPGTDKPTAWSPMATTTLALGTQVDLSLWAAAAGNGTDEIAVQFTNLSGSSLPALTYRDESPVPNSNEVYTVTFKDVDDNVSAASAALTVAVPASSADVDGPTDPVVTLTAGQNQISFEITTPSTDPSGVAGYTIRYGTSANPTAVWNNTDTVLHTTATGVITGLTDSTAYFVTFEPIDNVANPGNVVATVPASVTTFPAAPPPDTRAPPAPTVTLTAIAGNPNALRVTRTAGANPEGIPVTQTKAFYGTTSGASGLESALIAVGGSTTQIDVPVTPGVQYWARARDYNEDGDPATSSPSSNTAGPVASQAPAGGSLSIYLPMSDPLPNGSGGWTFPTNEIGNYQGAAVEPRALPSTDHAREGGYSAKTRVKWNDPSPTNTVNHRGEISPFGVPNFIQFGSTICWYGWSFWLDPATWNVIDGQHPEVLQQNHNQAWTTGVSNNPQVHIGNEADNRRVLSISSLTDHTRVPTGPQENKSTRSYYSSPFPRGQWLDCVVRARWDHSDALNGFYQLWVTPAPTGVYFESTQLTLPAIGQQSLTGGVWMVNDRGKNCWNTTLDGGTNTKPNFKMAMYKAAWRYQTPSAITSAGRLMYTGPFRFGRESDGVGYNDVRPRGTAS